MIGQGWGKCSLQRRTILCDNPPDLPIVLVTMILLYSNKININLFKEVWDVAFFICSGWQIQMPRTNHAMHSMFVVFFIFCFWLLA